MAREYIEPMDSPMSDRKHMIHSRTMSTVALSESAQSTLPVKCVRSFRKLFLTSNLVKLVSGLILMGTGASLMGFYRLHLLEVITIEFLIVPLFMIIGGFLTLVTSVFGLYINARDSSCLMVTYSVLITAQMIMLLAGVGCAVHLIFVIQTGIFDADVIPELSLYENDEWVRYKWDTLQREFSCCGGYGYLVGYTDYKHTVVGGARNSVPDSCCLKESSGCGFNIFRLTDVRVLIGKIHIHGCLTTMMRRLDTHVMIILVVFAVVGSLLVLLELLVMVLSCCMASQIAAERSWEEYEDNLEQTHNLEDEPHEHNLAYPVHQRYDYPYEPTASQMTSRGTSLKRGAHFTDPEVCRTCSRSNTPQPGMSQYL